MKHLLVGGAGAVGVTYALALHRAGHSVGIYVRPKRHADYHAAAKAKIEGSKNSGNIVTDTQPVLTAYDVTPRAKTHILLVLAVGAAASLAAFVPLGFFSLLSLFLCPVAFLAAAYFAAPHTRAFAPTPVATAIPLACVACTPAEVAAYAPDVIWICLASDELRSPMFQTELRALLLEVPNNKVICLSPGVGDAVSVRALLAANGQSSDSDANSAADSAPTSSSSASDDNRVAAGTLPIISYQVPLAEERFPCCPALPADFYDVASKSLSAGYAAVPIGAPVAIFFPPLAAMAITALDPQDPGFAAAAAATTRGGLPAAVARATPTSAVAGVFVSTLFTATIAATRAAGWRSAAAFADGQTRALCAEAAQQGVAVNALRAVPGETREAALAKGVRARYAALVALGAFGFLAPLVMPFDFEAYFKYHFSKVWKQTENNVALIVDGGKKFGLPTDKVEKLFTLATKND